MGVHIWMGRICSMALLASISTFITAPKVDVVAQSLERCVVSSLYTPEAGHHTDPVGEVLDPADLNATAAAPTQPPPTLGPTTIPVWFHVITDGVRGNIPDAALLQEIQIMNDSFSGATGGATSVFRFTLGGIDRTTNTAWFEMRAGSSAELEAKQALRQGDAKTLNVYTADSYFIDSDGRKIRTSFATFPWSYSFDPKRDGVVMNVAHVLGGGGALYPRQEDPGVIGVSTGDVIVHETGHWLGLYHTFQGYGEDENGVQTASGCAGSGDFVEDTPAQDSPSGFCPVGRDSCPAAGTDPIHNFMDYSGDLCAHEFTPGQVTRMNEKWLAHRANAKPPRGRRNR